MLLHITLVIPALSEHFTDSDVNTCEHEQIVIDPEIEPTCISIGWTEGSHCAICGKIIVPQEIIPGGSHVGHQEVIDPGIPPTCTESGLTEGWHCALCGSYLEQKTIEATGHDWGEAEYIWSVDNTTVTASRVCHNDSSHIEIELAKSNWSIMPPEEKRNGFAMYISEEFSNSAFKAQKKK